MHKYTVHYFPETMDLLSQEEWSAIQARYATIARVIIIDCDLNIYLDIYFNRDAQSYPYLINSLRLQQHVHESSHVRDLKLYIVINRSCTSAVSSVYV